MQHPPTSPPPPAARFSFPGESPVRFEPDSTAFTDPAAAITALTPIARWLAAGLARHASLEGSTAGAGTRAGQIRLCLRRASRVRNELIALGAPPAQITAAGAGSHLPPFIPGPLPGRHPPGRARHPRPVRPHHPQPLGDLAGDSGSITARHCGTPPPGCRPARSAPPAGPACWQSPAASLGQRRCRQQWHPQDVEGQQPPTPPAARRGGKRRQPVRAGQAARRGGACQAARPMPPVLADLPGELPASPAPFKGTING